MRAFEVVARRWERGWELHIDGVGVTQSRNVRDAEAMVRDYLRLEGVKGPFKVDIDFKAGGDLDAEIEKARQAEEEALRAQERAAAMKRAVAQRLHQKKYRGTEIAAVLRVSPQRASQLLQAKRPTGRRGVQPLTQPEKRARKSA
ncbi:MAG: hypothetical protein ACRDTQ_03180 [Micromonosporaceae bacterium]